MQLRCHGLKCVGAALALALPAYGMALEGFGTVEFQGAAAPTGPSAQIGTPPRAVTLGFDIVLNFINTPSAAEQAAFQAAEAQWESIIQGYQSNDLANTNVNIDVYLAGIDGEGGTLGSAGPTTAKLNAAQNAVNPDFVYAQSGVMNFDTADTPGLITAGTFDDVVYHEMGHVLGIGTLWSSSAVGFAGRQELYVNGSGEYTGAAGLAAYNAEFGQVGTFVPVELGGGPGTANGHWNEVDGGAGATGITSLLTGDDFRDEIMTGWLNTPAFTSQLTIQGMVDLGYVVPEPTAGLLLTAVVGFVGLGRRRAA